ncbi:MAG: L,D-transpeptidase [Desulfomonilaceae bacterium]
MERVIKFSRLSLLLWLLCFGSGQPGIVFANAQQTGSLSATVSSEKPTDIEQASQAKDSQESLAPQPVPEAQGCPKMPYDPCLPSLYRDWREYSEDQEGFRISHNIEGARILINRARFEVSLDALLKDGSTVEFYRGNVALGAFDSPTPIGGFMINHIYCYPDVVFFASDSKPVPHLYKGFFAPLLICDENGHCQRYHELGLHGFEISAYPHPGSLRSGLIGPVSGGCIRVGDPCALKKSLVKLVGVGIPRQNERGFYHWLSKNVEVIIFDEDRETDQDLTIAGILEGGISSLGAGLRGIIGMFQR